MQTVRVSKEVVEDHMSRLYDGFTHVDGADAGEVIWIQSGKRIATVTLSDEAVKEMLRDFDYYADLLGMRGVIEDSERPLCQAMKRAAAAIRKQTNQ